MEDFQAYSGDEAGSSGADDEEESEEDAGGSDGDEQGRKGQHAKRSAPQAGRRGSTAKRQRPMDIEYEIEHEMEPMRSMQSMQH